MESKDLRKIIIAVIALLTTIVGVLDPGALNGNITNFVTNYQEHSEDSDHGILNVFSESNPSSESEKEIHLTVSPTPSTKDTSSINKAKYHHTKHDNDVEEVDDSTTNSVDVTNGKNEPRVGDKEVIVSVEKVEPPSIDSFKVDSDKITSGESTTLSWSVSGATYINISPGIGSVSSSGSMTVSPTKDTTYTIITTNKGGSIKDNVIVSVKETESPKINTFKVVPEKITAGDSATLNWSVSSDAEDVTLKTNIGDASSSSFFLGIIRKIDIKPDIRNVSPNGSLQVDPKETTTYTITATNEAGSDEKEVTVSVDPVAEPEPSTIDSFEVYPEEITAGKSTTLSWSVSGATDVTIEPDIGPVNPSGSMSVNPAETTTYTITATNGVENTEDTATASVTEPEPLTIDSFEVYPEEIIAGKSTTLSWSVSGATDVTIEPDIGPVNPSGSMSVNPAETTTYTITATNEAGSDEKEVTVSVDPVAEPEPSTIDSFEVYPEEITAGKSTTLSWSVSGATDVTIEPDIGPVNPSGSMSVNSAETTTYTITATNEADSVEDTATVSVTEPEPPTIDSFEVYPYEITAGDTITLSWSVSGATDVTIEPDIGPVNPSGSMSVNPAETTTYTITATNEADSVEDTITLYVDPVAEPEPSELESSEDDSEYFV